MATSAREARSTSAACFSKAPQAQFQFIPYRGAAPAMQALMAGDLDFIINDPASALPQVRGGKIKAFAVTAKNRLIPFLNHS